MSVCHQLVTTYNFCLSNGVISIHVICARWVAFLPVCCWLAGRTRRHFPFSFFFSGKSTIWSSRFRGIPTFFSCSKTIRHTSDRRRRRNCDSMMKRGLSTSSISSLLSLRFTRQQSSSSKFGVNPLPLRFLSSFTKPPGLSHIGIHFRYLHIVMWSMKLACSVCVWKFILLLMHGAVFLWWLLVNDLWKDWISRMMCCISLIADASLVWFLFVLVRSFDV